MTVCTAVSPTRARRDEIEANEEIGLNALPTGQMKGLLG